MKHATVVTENGYTWQTDVNGTDESICKYFLGNYFNTAPFPVERLSMAVEIKIDDKNYKFDRVGSIQDKDRADIIAHRHVWAVETDSARYATIVFSGIDRLYAVEMVSEILV